jgi:hypothetical protein
MHSTEITTPVRLRAALGITAFKAVFGAAVAAGMLGAGQAQALHVTVNGQRWNVNFFDGTQGGPNAALFQTAANGGRMPWFTNNATDCGTPTSDKDVSGSNCLAVQFAKAVGNQLNGMGGMQTLRFAFSGMTSNQVGSGQAGIACPPPNPSSDCLRTGQFIISNGTLAEVDTEPQQDPIPGNPPTPNTARWAYADLVPGPLPLFGVAAAFGFSRKLRKRINDSKAACSSFPAA